MKKQLKTTVLVLYIAQLIFMICAIASGIYGWRNGGVLIYIIAGVFLYGSMFFHGLKIHLGRLISNDFETQTKKSIALWSGMNRRKRKIQEKAIKKELRKNKK